MPLLPVGWMYRRLGKAYPVAFFVLQLSIGMLVSAGTLFLVTLLYEGARGEFWTLLAITEALTVVGLTYGLVRALRRLRSVRAWIGGRRDEPSTLAAWDAAVNLPARVFRQDAVLPLLLTGVPSVIAVVVIGDLPWTALLPLTIAGAVAVVYAAVLQYFAIEIGMRPLVDDICAVLPPEFKFEALGISLRLKLLTILPLMSVLTGLVVTALTGGDDADLGLSVLVTLAVAFSIALELTVLLSDSIARPLNALHDGIVAVEEGRYDARIPVTTSDEFGELAHGFNRMVAGLAERERLRQAFGTYLDKEVAEYILSDGFSAEGIEVDVSILFCDVRDFTGFAAQAEAAEVVAALNGLFEVIVPIVARHGGHVDKFVGDGLLAVFGAPEGFADHADRAVAAGREIVEAVESGRAGDLRVGVGINSGPVVAGAIGGAGRLNFSVIGDAVNVAARVEAATRDDGDPLLIAADTRDALVGGVALVSRGEATLKGRTEPIELFAPADGDDGQRAKRSDPAGAGLTAARRG
jgi:adenylate cyclase